MNYVCKNCGAFISKEELEKAATMQGAAVLVGCLIWFIIIICCVSIILIPIAIILILKEFNKMPLRTCPYCDAKDTLIPESSPLAIKIIEENFNELEKSKIEILRDNQNRKIQREKIEQEIEQEKNEKTKNGCVLTFIIGFIIWFICSLFS